MNTLPEDLFLQEITPYLSCLDLFKLGCVNKSLARLRNKRMFRKFWHHVDKALREIDFNFYLGMFDKVMHLPDILIDPQRKLRVVHSKIFNDIFNGDFFSSSYINPCNFVLEYHTFARDIFTADQYTDLGLITMEKRQSEDAILKQTYLPCEVDQHREFNTIGPATKKRYRHWVYPFIEKVFTKDKYRSRQFEIARGFILKASSYTNEFEEEHMYERATDGDIYIQGSTLVVPQGVS